MYNESTFATSLCTQSICNKQQQQQKRCGELIVRYEHNDGGHRGGKLKLKLKE